MGLKNHEKNSVVHVYNENSEHLRPLTPLRVCLPIWSYKGDNRTFVHKVGLVFQINLFQKTHTHTSFVSLSSEGKGTLEIKNNQKKEGNQCSHPLPGAIAPATLMLLENSELDL